MISCPGSPSQIKCSRSGSTGTILCLIVLLLATMSCSRNDRGETAASGRSATVGRAIAGESAGAAHSRVLDECMASIGEVGVPNDAEVEGTKITILAYPDTPEVNRHLDECRLKADAAVPIPELTADDLRAFHARFAKALDCVRQQGFDPGTMISVEEYVANGAPNGLTSKWPQLSQDRSFMERFIKCSDGIPPIKQGS